MVLAVAASGWAGWVVGGKSRVSGTAATGPTLHSNGAVTGMTPDHRPAPAAPGWSGSGWPAFLAADFSTASGLTQRTHENPEAVRREVMAQAPGPARNAAILDMLRGWVGRDPVAAADWFASLDPAATPDMPLADVEPIFSSAPAEARAKGVLGFLAAKLAGPVLNQAAKGSVKSIERPSPPFLMRLTGPWSGSLGSPENKTLSDTLNARTHALAVWAAQEPERSLEWIRARPTPESRLWLMNAMVEALARTGAADQAIQLYNAETDLHEQGAVRSLGKAWASADPTAALAWSNQLPDPALRDQFLDAALRECPDGQAPELLEFTSHLNDPERRQALREQLVTRAAWNQAAVRSWLDTDTTLDPGERDHWRAHLAKAAEEAVQDWATSRLNSGW